MTREEAIETVLAMAKVQDGYAKRATDPGLKIIHKANAKAQREVAAVIAADLAALDRVRSDYANIVKDLIAKQTEIVAAEAANAAMTAREGALRAFIDDFATAKIDALRYQPSYGESPEDEPDPVVDATEVWAWQSDAKDILALKETPDA
jgi:hypothetical protein